MNSEVSSIVHALSDAGPWVAAVCLAPRCASGCVLSAGYLAAAFVALFHRDPARRAEARFVLDRHPFTRGRTSADAGTTELREAAPMPRPETDERAVRR